MAKVARFFGVNRRTVSDWLDKGCPQVSKSEFELGEMVDWWGKHVAAIHWAKRENDAMGELKRVQLQQKIRQQDLEYAKEVDALLPRAHVEEFLMRVAELYRRAGELLRKHHGDTAQKILHDAIDAAEKELEMMLDK